MSEEQSVITEFACVEVGAELDIGYLDIIAVKGLRSCEGIHLVDG